MYYNIDIEYAQGEADITVRKVTKVTEAALLKFIKLYLTKENRLIITEYIQ